MSRDQAEEETAGSSSAVAGGYAATNRREEPPTEPGYYWFREVTNSEKKGWQVVEVIPFPDQGLFSLTHGDYVERVGKGERWDAEWGPRITEPPSEDEAEGAA